MDRNTAGPALSKHATASSAPVDGPPRRQHASQRARRANDRGRRLSLRVIGTSRGDEGQRPLRPEDRGMATAEDRQCHQRHGAPMGDTLSPIRTAGGIGTTEPHRP
jgi:hypothetical protein